ncbi:Tetratricopeptide TPR_2 [Paramicrosporidium saccamoebae]|uniref:Tetratricopeptide TPR_2 n=1 Tax=Paramicrosporidium saccamoebae TaxID=1246581 RepID=A0A2H9TJP0_9FUNG|nr:Tetratricopeptide TPR_2 [Paramicrosporidium saccamoebae]
MLATGVVSCRKPAPIPSGSLEDRLDQQVERLERQLLETQKKGDLVEESRLCNNIAKTYERLCEYRKALNFHHYDRQISEAAGDVDGLLLAMGNMADTFLSMGMIDLAKSHLQEQLDFALKNQNMPQAFNAHSSIGNLFLSEAEGETVDLVCKEILAEAGVSFYRGHKVLDDYETLIENGLLSSNRRTDLKRLRLRARVNDGRLCMQTEEYDAALTKLRIALDGARDLKDQMLQFEILGLMGQTFLGMKETASAIEQCFDLQLTLAKEMKEPEFESEALLNLGLAYRDLWDFELSLKTLYLYKDHVKMQCVDSAKLEDADQEIQTTLEFKSVAEKITALEAKIKNDRHTGKTYLKLARNCRQLGFHQDAILYARKGADELDSDAEALRIACELCIEQGHGQDGVYFAKKHLGIIEPDGDTKACIDALLLLSDSYWLLPTLPAETLRVLQKALDLSRQKTSRPREIDILSKLASAYKRLGLDNQYMEIKEECMTLWRQHHLDDDRGNEAQIVAELGQLDYFVNRKPSKNVMKLVDGQFNMKSRSRGTKGLEIKRARRKTTNVQPQMARKKRIHVISDNDSDMRSFIVDDEADGRTDPSLPERHAMDYDDPPMPEPELIWPPSPKRSVIQDDQRSCTKSASRRTWSGDPAFIATILRVKVLIFDEALIIPIIDDIAEQRTISWLIGEIAARYRADFGGKEPLIDALLTEDGARLCGGDPVAVVLSDGQSVRARVVGFKTQSLAQIYTVLCNECGLTVNTAVLASLSTDDAKIDVSRWIHDESHFDLVIRAVASYSGEIVSLDLSHNHLVTDRVLEELAALKSLQELDISFTFVHTIPPIPVKCLRSQFCDIVNLSKFIKTITSSHPQLKELDLSGVDICGVDLGDLHYLEGLERLILSYCPMDAISGMGLAELIRKTSSLRVLDLAGCLAGEHLGALGTALEVNVTLHELILTGNGIVLCDLAKTLETNPRKSLKRLVL